MKIVYDTLLKMITLKGAINCADFEQTKSEQPIARTHNTGLVKVAIQCSADTFVVNQTFVLRINICGKITTFAKPENVVRHAIEHSNNLK